MSHPQRSSNTASRSEIELVPITKEQASVLRNLFQLYAHDFSEHMPLDIGPDGRFAASPDDRWFEAEGHHPFFIRQGDHWVGFALAKRGSRLTGAGDVMDVAEFFVARGARRRRVGSAAARALFESLPGKWEIRVRRTNIEALPFWRRAVESWTGRAAATTPFTAEGVEWDLLRIDTPPG